MNRAISGVLMLVALAYTVAAWRLPRFQMSTMVDAHVFPVAIGLILFALSIWLWFKGQTVIRLPDRLGPSALLAVLMLLYTLLLRPLGFVIATAAFIMAAAAVLGWRRWVAAFLVAAGFSAGTYYAFVRLLSVPLPAGILPWLGG